jgi:HlyD family secretion protein
LLTKKSQLQSEIKTLKEQITEKEGTLNENSSVLEQKYVIKSPITGIVKDINYIRGEYPSLGTPLATITKSKKSELMVLATASSGDADKLIPGDAVLFTPSNVNRNRYGGITGKVLSVERRPVSSEYIVNFTGNQSIGEELAKDQHLYLVKIKLSRSANSPTGFAWSSGSGPELRQKPYSSLLGETTVYYEEKTPISYVLPFLRGVIGLSDNDRGS